jgi:copper chaperone CopZ
MTHTYSITNMTCSNCVAKVKSQLLIHPDIISADVQLEAPQATITMQQHLSLEQLQTAIGTDSKYKISTIANNKAIEPSKTWLQTYKPLLLIFAFITGVSLIAANNNWHQAMNYFMAGFFLVFSFFKFLDLKAFANSYAMYDLLAKKIPAYGYAYPFIELALGLAYLTGFNPMATTTATIIVMGFSSIGVIKSVFNKQQIRCACLGAVFNLPMSTVTIIEDLLMVAMAIIGHLHYHHL